MHNFYDIISSGMINLKFDFHQVTHNSLVQLMVLAVFLPLLGSLISGLLQRNDRFYIIGAIVSFFVLLSAAISLYILYLFIYRNHEPFIINLWTWFSIDLLKVKFSINVDMLSVLMMFTVNTVSSMVHIYSISYMSEDRARIRFLSYLSLFTFFMLMLVVSSNFVQLFFGWEGVGLCSYLLIGFWFEKQSANDAALKAFLVNRVGDMALIIGIFLIFYVCGSLDFNDVLYQTHGKLDATLGSSGIRYIDLICVCLFIGSMGKSAQLGLHTWLPDAMEGPTPVSALIHAATMVTAGVFLLARCSPLLEHSIVVLQYIAVIGAITAFVAATVAMVQNDIKRIIAYSTCSQLGYMFFACGVSAYSAAMFHLFTHAFFKALLFLGAGSVIHGLHGEQDITKMGGLAKKMKLTYFMMAIGSLALIGVFPFAGFYSKDAILEAAYLKGGFIGIFTYTFGLLTAVLTALYSARLFLLTFHGKTQLSTKEYNLVHDSSRLMLGPMVLLALGAITAGFVGEHYGIISNGLDFWSRGYYKKFDDNMFIQHIDSILNKDNIVVPEYIKLLPMILAIIAFIFFAALYRKNGNKAAILPDKLPKYLQFLRKFPTNKYYFDVIYSYVFVLGLKKLSNILRHQVDYNFIDQIPRGIAAFSLLLAGWQNKLQTGYLYHYAISMVLAIVLGSYIVLYNLPLN